MEVRPSVVPASNDVATPGDGLTATPDSRNESTPGQPWFALWTRSRHEQIVCTELSLRQIEFFLPTVLQVSHWKDRTKRIAWPLFPGYCFARFDASRFLAVRKCTGVVAVLSNGLHPIPVPEHEIAALQRLMASGLDYTSCASLELGALMRVVRGPLRGIIGRLVRKGPQDQLVLAVDVLNSGARVHVLPSDIRPA